jgi:hypothetical protein
VSVDRLLADIPRRKLTVNGIDKKTMLEFIDSLSTKSAPGTGIKVGWLHRQLLIDAAASQSRHSQ